MRIGAALLVLMALVALRMRFNGAGLARTIEDILNQNMRGRIEIGSVEWPLGSVSKALTGGWIPVTIRDVRVYDDGGMKGEEVDDARRKLILQTDLITGYIDAHSLMFGHHDFVIRDLVIPNGGYVLIEQVAEPYPIHPYDTKVVSLASAFFPRLEAGFRAGLSATSSPIFDIRSFDLNGVTLELVFPGTQLVAKNVHAAGLLYSEHSDPLRPKVYYSLAPTAESAMLRLGDISTGSTVGRLAEGKPPTIYEIPLYNLEISHLAQLPMDWPRDSVAYDVEWKLTADSIGGASITLRGALRNYWLSYLGGDYDDFELSIRHAGALMSQLSQGLAGGDDLALTLTMSGPSLGPRFTVKLEKLDLSVPLGEGSGQPGSTSGSQKPGQAGAAARDSSDRLSLHLEKATATFDQVTGRGTLEDTVARGADGEVRLAADFGLAPVSFDVHLDITRAINVGPYLPAEVVDLTGSRLRGELHVFGDGSRQQMDKLDLWLGRAHITGALLRDEGKQTIHLRELAVTRDRTSVTSRGTIQEVDGTVDMELNLDSEELDVLLGRLGTPAMIDARELHGNVRVRGRTDTIRGGGEITVGGISVAGVPLGELRSLFNYKDQVLTLEEVKGSPLGGILGVRGRLRLGPRPRLLDFDGKLTRLNLAEIPALRRILAGRLSATAKASGSPQRLVSELALEVAELAVGGDRYQLPDKLIVRTHKDGSKELFFRLQRDKGGSLSARASANARGELGGEISLDALPLPQLAVLGGMQNSPIGGMLTAALQLGGTTAAPTADGAIRWSNGWLSGTHLGAGGFRVRPIGPDRIALEGSLLQGDIRISAAIQTRAPYDTEVKVNVRRVELDRFAGELAAAYGVRGWVSGEILAHTTLVPTPGRPLAMSMRLTETEVWIDNEDSDGRPAPIRLHNKPGTLIAVDFDGTTARLKDKVVLVGPGGAELELSGSGSTAELGLELRGSLAMTAFEPYLRDLFDSVAGRLGVALTVSGPPGKPDVVLQLKVEETVRVQPRGQDAQVSVRQDGIVTITNNQLTPTGLALIVHDPYTGEEALLEIKGGVSLDDFVPVRLGVIIEGELSGKMLLVAAPEVFSRASGVASLELTLAGTPTEPRIDGELSFGNEHPLTLTPRGLRREIRLTSGALVIENGQDDANDQIRFQDVAGSIDDEGKITAINGEIDIVEWRPVGIDVTLSADSLPFRIPQTLDLTLSLDRLRVVGSLLSTGSDTSGLDIIGGVEIVDGRYVRNFNLITDALRPAESTDTSEPFYERTPVVANARLDLDIAVRGFFVQNNLANIQLAGVLDIEGTPREPRVGGEIKVDQGVFKLPAVRARFIRTNGSVSFSEFKNFPTDTPTLNVQSEADYRDPSGQEHLVTFAIRGPLSNLNWDLYTSSGLNKGQTVTMLFSGRTPEEFRKQIGDEAPGRDPGRVDPSTNPNENLADQIIKDLASDAISLLVEDKLRNLTTLDVARLEIGTGSIGFHGEKEVFKNLRFLGDLEQTLRGSTVDVRGEYRVTDKLSVEGEYLSKDYEEDSDEDISDHRLRMVRRFFVP